MVSRKRIVLLLSLLLLVVIVEEGVNILQQGKPHRNLRYMLVGTIECDGHTLHLNPKDEVFNPLILEDGRWEPAETALFKANIRAGDTVVDVGAHIGYYTVLGAALAGPAGRVIAFEPDPESFSFLTRNVEANGFKNVALEQKALSNESGTIKLFLSDENRGDQRIYQTGERPSIEVKATTLDEYLLPGSGAVDFIKIDTQGAELVILKGMQETLTRNRDVKLVLEFWPHGLAGLGSDAAELLGLLQSLGFEFYDVKQDRGIAVRTDPATLLTTYTIASETYTNVFCRRPRPGVDEPVLDLRTAAH